VVVFIWSAFGRTRTGKPAGRRFEERGRAQLLAASTSQWRRAKPASPVVYDQPKIAGSSTKALAGARSEKACSRAISPVDRANIKAPANSREFYIALATDSTRRSG
jgi:hypothetical protein